MSDTDLLTQARERRDRLLEVAVKTAGKGRTALGDDSRLHLETVSMDPVVGVTGIDEMLGGGWRRGRMGMVIGEASMGKTLLTQWTIKAFQQLGYVCGFIDPEKTYDAEWFQATGVRVQDVIVVRPESSEQAFDLACRWAEKGMDLIVIDSLAALVPKARMENDLETQEYMGLNPRKISEGLAKLTGSNINSFILCTNQLRSKLGIVYGSPDEIPGGRAQRFYASYIVKVSRGEWIKDGTHKDARRIGFKLKLETQKNKLAPPYQTARVPFLFSGVVDQTAGVVEVGIELGVIAGKKGFFRWHGQTFHGIAKLKEFLAESPEELAALQEEIGTGEMAMPDFGDGS